MSTKTARKPKHVPNAIDTQTAFLEWLAKEVAKEGDEYPSELIEMANSVMDYFDAVEDDCGEGSVIGLAELQDARAAYNGPGIVRAADSAEDPR